METPKIIGYRVIALAKSNKNKSNCPIDIDFDDSIGRCYDIDEDCHHKHRTHAAACRCRAKQVRSDITKWQASTVQPIFCGYECAHIVISVKVR
jgi:hypothetical protein